MSTGSKEAALRALREARVAGVQKQRTASPSTGKAAEVTRRVALAVSSAKALAKNHPDVSAKLSKATVADLKGVAGASLEPGERVGAADDRIIFAAPAGLRPRLEAARKARGERSISETIRSLLEEALGEEGR